MSKKIITHNNGIVETRETFYTEKTIQQLKQQLVEKDEEIKKLNWQLKDKDFIIKNLNHSLSVAPNANAGQRARIDELTKIVKEKDKEIKSLIVDYEKRISQEQELMSNIEHRLVEKQNTINEINREFVQAVHDWKALCAEKDKEIERLKQITIFKDSRNMTTKINGVDFSDEQIIILQNLDVLKKHDQTQLAIAELEKVKKWVADHTQDFWSCENDDLDTELYDFIDNQIEELKGE